MLQLIGWAVANVSFGSRFESGTVDFHVIGGRRRAQDIFVDDEEQLLPGGHREMNDLFRWLRRDVVPVRRGDRDRRRSARCLARNADRRRSGRHSVHEIDHEILVVRFAGKADAERIRARCRRGERVDNVATRRRRWRGLLAVAGETGRRTRSAELIIVRRAVGSRTEVAEDRHVDRERNCAGKRVIRRRRGRANDPVRSLRKVTART